MTAAPTRPSEILDAAAALIEPEGKWCQGADALDSEGCAAEPNEDAAVCWCAVGAMKRVAPDEAIEISAWRFLQAYIPGGIVTCWNDSPSRQQPEVVAALRRAADLAREEGK